MVIDKLSGSGKLNHLKVKENDATQKRIATVNSIDKLVNRNQNIWRSQLIVDEAQYSYDIKVSKQYVADVLKNCRGMAYRKVKKVSFQGNSYRSLVLRQLGAKVVLDLL